MAAVGGTTTDSVVEFDLPFMVSDVRARTVDVQPAGADSDNVTVPVKPFRGDTIKVTFLADPA